MRYSLGSISAASSLLSPLDDHLHDHDQTNNSNVVDNSISLMDLDETLCSTKAAADSALRLLQHAAVDASSVCCCDDDNEDDESNHCWISATTEPLRYRKNLGAAFEQAEQQQQQQTAKTTTTSLTVDDQASKLGLDEQVEGVGEENAGPTHKNNHPHNDESSSQQPINPFPVALFASERKKNKQQHTSATAETATHSVPTVSESISSNLTASRGTSSGSGSSGSSGSSSSSNKNTIAVFLRTRPSSDATNTIEIASANNGAAGGDVSSLPRHIRTRAPDTSNASKFHRGGNNHATTGGVVAKEYEFTGVLGPDVSQATVYACTVRPLLKGLIANNSTGDNNKPQSALAFCYGITNAGKTYTVTGTSQHGDRDWGLVPRTLRDLWDMCSNQNNNSKNGSNRQLQLSYFEVYNEQQYDLLLPPQTQQQQQSKSSTNHYNNPYLLGNSNLNHESMTRHTVTSLQDGLQQISLAQKNRRSGANGINTASSRSHAICQFTIFSKESSSSSNIHSANLWMVDLAGSERAKRTAGKRWQEAVQINKSLMTLNRCLMALRSSSNNNTTVVPPYRESKLTQIFGQHWTSASAARTVMIVNVNPAAADFDETQHALAYASAARTVRVGSSNSSASSSSNNKTTTETEYGYDGRRVHSTKNGGSSSRGVGGGMASQCMKTLKAVVKKLSPKKKNPLDARSKRIMLQQKQPHPDSKRVRLGSSPPPPPAHDHKDIKTTGDDDCAGKDYHSMQVRCQLLDEMDGKMQAMKLQSSSKEAAAVAKASEKVADLMETVQECEDEMKRMRQEHGRELARQKSKYERVLRDKNMELHQKEAHLHQLETKVEELTLEIAKQLSSAQQQHPSAVSTHDVELILASKANDLQAKDECIATLQRQVKLLQHELGAQGTRGEVQKAALCKEIEQLVAELEHSRAEVASLRRATTEQQQQHQIHQSITVDIENKKASPKPFKKILGNIALNHRQEPNSSNNIDDSFGPLKGFNRPLHHHQNDNIFATTSPLP